MFLNLSCEAVLPKKSCSRKSFVSVLVSDRLPSDRLKVVTFLCIGTDRHQLLNYYITIDLTTEESSQQIFDFLRQKNVVFYEDMLYPLVQDVQVFYPLNKRIRICL